MKDGNLLMREGFWKCGKESLLPFPKQRKHPWKGKTKFLACLLKAQEKAKRTSYRGFSWCRICKCSNGSQDFRIGNWLWPSGYYHYIEKHNVRPSLAFQEFILGRRIK